MRKLQLYKDGNDLKAGNKKIKNFNFDSLKKPHSTLDKPRVLTKGTHQTLPQEPERASKFQHQAIYGEQIRSEPPAAYPEGAADADAASFGHTRSNMMPQSNLKTGPSKYFDKVTDLFDIDDEFHEKKASKGVSLAISDDSGDENGFDSSLSNRNIVRQFSMINEWNGG
jgi:hypothetical protein